ncbi:glycosyltransferase [Planktotalea sp.]|uniref:glycosyltransferase n=1 Tax=Planktotalea sp. TaxID=2029877 RepID=UPI003297A47E
MSKTRTVVLHLVDDTTAGGVMQVIDFLTNSRRLARDAEHRVVSVLRGKFSGVPKGADVLVSHTAISWSTLPGLVALRASFPKTPIIHVEHSYTEAFVAHNVRRKTRFGCLLKVAFALFDRVVAVSRAQARWILENKLCSERRLVTIQSCVDLSSFRALKAVEGPVRTFGAIGRLDPQKGFDVLIEAFTEIENPALRLIVTGQGPELEKLQALAGDDPRISFAGYTADASAAYARVDAVVMPSRWEAYGLVAIEALAARRAVLCADVDGMRDHSIHGAQYIEKATVAGTKSAIEKLVQRSETTEITGVDRPFSIVEAKAESDWLNLIAETTERRLVPENAVA